MPYPPDDRYQQGLDEHYRYDRAVIARSLRFWHRQRLDAILRIISSVPGKRLDSFKILDAGCGSGANVVRCAGHGAEVIGVDLSEGALKEARQWVESESVQHRVKLVRGDILNLPFKEGSFDLVICSDVLSVSGYPDRALCDMARLLKDGGVAVIAVPNYLSLFWTFIWVQQQLALLLRVKVPEGNRFTRFSYLGIRSVIRRYGLRVDRACGIYIVPFLHFEAYERLERTLRFAFPLKYTGTHILVEAFKQEGKTTKAIAPST